MHTVAFLIYGCRLNQAEAAEWQAQLATRGFTLVSPKADADILCVHSCAVTEPALHEIEKTLRAYRNRHPQTRIILSGCAATLLPDELRDLAIPHTQKTEWLARVLTFLALPNATPAHPPPQLKTRASLIVQDGCDRFCAYCIVPHLRGAPTSVPMSHLLQRATTLFAEGYREIVLTGCHLALYRDPESGGDFLSLLQRLADIKGEGRFRIGSLEPCVLDDKALIRLIAEMPERICPFLHLPIQTASTTLLHAMYRRYTHEELHSLLDTLCEMLPTCGLGADWIVGLPGETDADAEATCRLVADYPFTGAHIFPYSPRPGTPAATFPNQVPGHRVKARIERLSALAEEVRRATLKTVLGQRLVVIPERFRDGRWEGWSAQRFRCSLPPSARRGELTPFIPSLLKDDILHP